MKPWMSTQTGKRQRKQKIFWVCGVLLLASLTAGCIRHRSAQRFVPSTVEPDEFRLMTWNVGYFALTRNKNLRDLDLGTLADTIRNSNAQAVVLQEVSTREQALHVAGKLGTGWTAHAVDTGHQGQILAVLTSLPTRRVEAAEAGGRGILGLALRHSSGKEIFLTGVHSPHPARGKENTRDSIEGAYAFTQQQEADLRIFAGDLNYQFDETTTDPDSLYLQLTDDMEDSTLSIGSTYYLGFRIDHVFHDPKGIQVKSGESGMIDLNFRLGRVPGFRDHRPIVVTFDLSDEPAS